MLIKAVLFDWDGTLVDSLPHIFEMLSVVAKKLNLGAVSQERIKENLGKTWVDFLGSLWPEEVNLVVRFNQAYEECGFEKKIIPAIPNVHRVIKKLKQQSYFLGIISNRDRQSWEKRFSECEIGLDSFDYVQVLDDSPYEKPDPRVFDAVKERLNGFKAIYVGDTVSDFHATVGTGIKFVGVLTGPTTVGRFIEAGVNIWNIIPSVADLPDFLSRRN
jgi:phosphoglycolate phosphatase